ncbi:Cytochrome c4 [hydrothermal vent metagenome]|uniref:Cytochrome c4 n=1 Tax=hydrothermal vent metagenome TaxID=652676 RepID=A0A3B0Z3K2_9ZZZZ
MKNIVRTSATAVVAMSLIFVFGTPAFAKGDAVAGKDKAGLCAGCHGDDGNSLSGGFPSLASQYEDYIVKQIKDFQTGHRANNETMAGMAAMVASVQDAKDIGAYFHSQKMSKEPVAPVDKKLAKQGKKIFNEGIPRKGVYGCVNCHGKNGKGKSKTISAFPIIGGQHKDYIIKELKDFRSGLRSNDPGGMMSDIAKKLDDKDIDAVANYLSGL